MPLGGEEINSGYKGYGLGMLVDLLCGLMSGSNYGPHVRHWSNYIDQVANLGQFFVAIDPNCFAPGFSDRLQVNPNRDYLNTGLSSRFSEFFSRYIENQVGLIRR